LSSAKHPAADLIAQKGATIEFFEVDLGIANTRTMKDHILRYFEQREMDDRFSNIEQDSLRSKIRAEDQAKQDRNANEVAQCGAAKKANKRIKNT
jgi:hypothetical protein